MLVVLDSPQCIQSFSLTLSAVRNMNPSSSTTFIVASVLLQLLAPSTASRVTATSQYDAFRAVHRTADDTSSKVTYAQRFALFEARSAEVAAHNAQSLSWTIAVNQFADFTQNEKQAMLGYKRVGGRWASSTEPSFLQTSPAEGEMPSNGINISNLAKVVDLREKTTTFVHDQGACGSCWAHAVAGALEVGAELKGWGAIKVATQQIVDCTLNPRHCGGSGGCHGATAEMALELVRSGGIMALDKYTSAAGGKCGQAGPSALKISSFVRLPENSASHLMKALSDIGPVAVSIAADKLFSYNKGVFSGCQPDTIVNHAVLALGYGKDAKLGDFFLIRNSWGANWGEEGHFRVKRFNDDNAYCGDDVKPTDGVYCEKNAPASVKVCGMCGITSDSAYPVIPQKTNLRAVETHDAVDQVVAKDDLLPVM